MQQITGYIYAIVNDRTKEQYIGATTSTVNIRISKHKWEAKAGYNKPLPQAIRQYGWDKFSVHTLEEITLSVSSDLDTAPFYEMLNQLEKDIIEREQPEYNTRAGGGGKKLTFFISKEEVEATLGMSVGEASRKLDVSKDKYYKYLELYNLERK